MERIIKGPVLVLGDNIDTDVILPGRFLELTDPVAIGSHCLAGLSETIAPQFPKGGLVAAGKNFGCGSSREHAPIALIQMGAAAVIADSFARIFYRNGINLGLPLIVCKGLSSKLTEGATVTLNLEEGTVTIESTGEILPAEPLSGKALEILRAGGIKPLMRRRFAGESDPS